MRTEGQSLFKKHRLVSSFIYDLPMGQDMARGVVRELLLRRGPAPGSPAAPAAGCAVPRAGASPAGHCPAPRGGTGEGEGLRTRRGQKDKGTDKRNGGEAGMGGQRKGGLLFFSSFYYPRVTPKENKEPRSKGYNTRVGRRYFCPPTSPGVSAMGFPCQPRYARRRAKTSLPRVEERAPIPGFGAPNTGRLVPPGSERGAVASALLLPAGLIVFSTQPRSPSSPSPSDNLQPLP